MEINMVTLQERIEMMPQRMLSKLKEVLLTRFFGWLLTTYFQPDLDDYECSVSVTRWQQNTSNRFLPFIPSWAVCSYKAPEWCCRFQSSTLPVNHSVIESSSLFRSWLSSGASIEENWTGLSIGRAEFTTAFTTCSFKFDNEDSESSHCGIIAHLQPASFPIRAAGTSPPTTQIYQPFLIHRIMKPTSPSSWCR